MNRQGGEINYPAILHLPVTSNSPSIYHPISRRKPYENQHGCCAKTFLDRHSLLHFTPPPSAQAAGDTADIRHKLWSDFDDFASIANPPNHLFEVKQVCGLGALIGGGAKSIKSTCLCRIWQYPYWPSLHIHFTKSRTPLRLSQFQVLSHSAP